MLVSGFGSTFHLIGFAGPFTISLYDSDSYVIILYKKKYYIIYKYFHSCFIFEKDNERNDPLINPTKSEKPETNPTFSIS